MMSQPPLTFNVFHQAVEAVIALIWERDTVTFPEITYRLSKMIPTEGEEQLVLGSCPNTLLWLGMSPEYAQVMVVVTSSRQITMKPSNFLVYAYDGEMPCLPLATKLTTKGFATPHWLPVCFRPNDPLTEPPSPTPSRTRQRVRKQPAPKRIGPSRGGSVYIILAEGTTHVKIGYSGDVAVRVRSFRTGNSHSLRILREIQIKWARRLEKTLHQRYARYCIHGDWFDLPPDILRQLLDEPFA